MHRVWVGRGGGRHAIQFNFASTPESMPQFCALTLGNCVGVCRTKVCNASRPIDSACLCWLCYLSLSLPLTATFTFFHSYIKQTNKQTNSEQKAKEKGKKSNAVAYRSTAPFWPSIYSLETAINFIDFARQTNTFTCVE